jgi:hypothetical protein
VVYFNSWSSDFPSLEWGGFGRLCKKSSQVGGSFMIFVTSLFLRWRVVSPTLNPQTGGLPLVVARMGEKRNSYRLLVEKPEGKWPLGRWVDNIRMDLGDVGWGDVDWIGLAKDRNRCRALVNSVLNLRVPWNAGKLLSGLTSSGLSSSAQFHRAN